MYHHIITDQTKPVYWTEENIPPFNEGIFSWNGKKPLNGSVTILVSVKRKEWSPWYSYAVWGSKNQSGNRYKDEAAGIEIDDDILIIKKEPATGFRVKIEPNESIYALHVCVSNVDHPLSQEIPSFPKTIILPIPCISQMKLSHQRAKDLCSPTSTTAVVNFLNNSSIDPIVFAEWAKDQRYNIYGNWVLNIAEASSVLGKTWQCWVQRMNGFNDVYSHLEAGRPVVVSVKGDLEGAPQVYQQGHLVAIRGYDAKNNTVLCMDPAFHSNEETLAAYSMNHFLNAWRRRRFLSYVFTEAPKSI